MSLAKIGKAHPPKFSEIMSRVTRGSNNPNFGKLGPSNLLFGRKRPIEVIEKIRISHLGKTHSQETKDKLGEIQKQRWAEGKYDSRSC
jgi:hypothetical protein